MQSSSAFFSKESKTSEPQLPVKKLDINLADTSCILKNGVIAECYEYENEYTTYAVFYNSNALTQHATNYASIIHYLITPAAENSVLLARYFEDRSGEKICYRVWIAEFDYEKDSKDELKAKLKQNLIGTGDQPRFFNGRINSLLDLGNGFFAYDDEGRKYIYLHSKKEEKTFILDTPTYPIVLFADKERFISIRFSNDEKVEDQFQIWNIKKRKLDADFQGHMTCRPIVLTGQRFVVALLNELRVGEITRIGGFEPEINSFPIRLTKEQGHVSALLALPDGNFVTARQNVLQIWNSENGACLFTQKLDLPRFEDKLPPQAVHPIMYKAAAETLHHFIYQMHYVDDKILARATTNEIYQIDNVQALIEQLKVEQNVKAALSPA